MFFPSRETIQIWTEEHKKATLPSTTLPIIDSDAPNKFKSGQRNIKKATLLSTTLPIIDPDAPKKEFRLKKRKLS